MSYWPNPWKVIYVPIEELAECHYGLGQPYMDMHGNADVLTKEIVLSHWKSSGEHLDAYILPQPSGRHSIGIRYGTKDYQYLSPLGDAHKVAELLEKFTNK